jgi:DNA-binding SARP family transcriptional activator
MHFAILGPLEVTGEDGPLPLGGPKQRIVLAHLVLEANQVVSAERLIDALWGDDLPDDPRSALRVYVSRIRSSLDTDSIEARAPGYLFKADRDYRIWVSRRPSRARQGQRIRAEAGRAGQGT